MLDAKLVFGFFMLVLTSWAVYWLVKSYKFQKNDLKYKTHFYWNIVNLIIAFGSLVFLFSQDSLSDSIINVLTIIVLINVFFDIGYVVVAQLLSRQENQKYKEVGSALNIQGIFLLILDVSIVISVSFLV